MELMMDDQGYTAWKYHGATAYHRCRMTGHRLDWDMQPDVIKRYPGAESIALLPVGRLGTASLRDLLAITTGPVSPVRPDLEALSFVLALGFGITCRRQQGGDVYTFRSAASAGALYPVDIYVDACRVEGLQPGLYHDRIDGFFLECLKKNGEAGIRSQRPFAVMYLTGVFVRSAWKYRDRAYRYILNDTGHVAANILLAARSLGFSYRLDYDFDDGQVNGFLGLDPDREVCLARISLFQENGDVFDTHVSPDVWGMSEILPHPDYGNGGAGEVPRAIFDMHCSSRITGPETPGKQAFGETKNGYGSGEPMTCPSAAAGHDDLPWAEALVRRRSRRNFHLKTLEYERFRHLLDRVVEGFCLMESASRVRNTLHLGCLVWNTDGVEPGHYSLNAEKQDFFCVDKGGKNALMASACLDQLWLANASVHFVMTTDVKKAEELKDARVYRRMMMNAGFLGQIIYLAATALGLGCCGIGAFFDEEAMTVLDGGHGESLLYLVAVGPVKGRI